MSGTLTDSLRKFWTLVLTTAAVLALSTGAEAGFFGDVWDGIKSVVSAPVRAVGWVVGQGVNSAIDPSLDNAFGRLRETTDHAIDRVDTTAKARIEQLDAVAKARIDQLDAVAKARIEQVDEVMKRRLEQADSILDDKLTKIEALATNLLDREAKILDQNVTRVEEILDKSLDRLQAIETDAFDRVDSALQDQVPFAASQIARSIEWTAVVIVFLVVLVGFGGIQLMRSMVNQPVGTTFSSRFLTSLRFVPRSLLTVGLPMLFLLAVVQSGYVVYYTKTDRDRIARLEDAGNLLERAGDFKAATNFRKRAFSLDGKTSRHYMVLRDAWLADFWQRHFGEDPVELSRRLSHLMTEPSFKQQTDADGEIQAASLYMQVSYIKSEGGDEQPLPLANAIRAQLTEQLKTYKTRFLQGSPTMQRPTLGKLAYMAELRLTLDDQSQEVAARLTAVKQVVDEMLAAKAYERYAPGLIFRAHLAAAQYELAQYSPKPPSSDAKIGEVPKAIQQDADAAFAADPDLVRYIRFRSASLPKDLVGVLQTISQAPADQRPNLKGAQGQPLVDEANKRLDAFSRELADLIGPLLGVDTLVRSKVERQICRSIRSDLGEALFKQQVDAARKSQIAGEDAPKRYAKCAAVYDSAIQVGKPQLAEAWLKETQALIAASPGPFQNKEKEAVDKQIQQVKETNLTSTMFYVF